MTQPNRIAYLALLTACTMAFAIVAFAQQPSDDPSLDEILLHLHNDFLQYHATVPDFFCDEHAVSRIRQRGTSIPPISTESSYRLRRNTEAGHTSLFESRDVRTINNQPAPTGYAVTGPAIFTGAFSQNLAFVNPDSRSCFDYVLGHHSHKIVIDYSPIQTNEHPEVCPAEPTSGRATIDPKSLRLVRIESRTPNHPMPGSRGLWTWTIDYGQIDLDGQTFWLPRTITSTAAADSLPIIWTFTASYSNCHKLSVTSHILPSGD